MARQKKQLAGQQFGDLYVIEDDPNVKSNVICKCAACGKNTSIPRSRFTTSKFAKSCGCLTKQARSHAAMTNFQTHYEYMRKYHTSPYLFHAKTRKNNTTGYTGVYYNQNTGKYTAQICVGYQKHHLGTFNKLADAVAARKEAEETYIAYLNEVESALDDRVVI